LRLRTRLPATYLTPRQPVLKFVKLRRNGATRIP
jgi:hypothetical protein